MNGPSVKKFYKTWNNSLLEYDGVTIKNNKVFDNLNMLWSENNEELEGDYIMSASLWGKLYWFYLI